ncbi:PREDICTED: translation initiation factor IF-2-like, partial [Chinchilla lanigera]|uniref:translation initiation factor IF-2-like n=1 Tax=Chinchilla lanigera TaxID=34839 RepID=UPI00038F02B5
VATTDSAPELSCSHHCGLGPGAPRVSHSSAGCPSRQTPSLGPLLPSMFLKQALFCLCEYIGQLLVARDAAWRPSCSRLPRPAPPQPAPRPRASAATAKSAQPHRLGAGEVHCPRFSSLEEGLACPAQGKAGSAALGGQQRAAGARRARRGLRSGAGARPGLQGRCHLIGADAGRHVRRPLIGCVGSGAGPPDAGLVRSVRPRVRRGRRRWRAVFGVGDGVTAAPLPHSPLPRAVRREDRPGSPPRRLRTAAATRGLGGRPWTERCRRAVCAARPARSTGGRAEPPAAWGAAAGAGDGSREPLPRAEPASEASGLLPRRAGARERRGRAEKPPRGPEPGGAGSLRRGSGFLCSGESALAVAQHCECTPRHRTVYFKVATFLLSEFHFTQNVNSTRKPNLGSKSVCFLKGELTCCPACCTMSAYRRAATFVPLCPPVEWTGNLDFPSEGSSICVCAMT